LNVLHLCTHVNIGGITSYIGTLSKAMGKKGHRSSVASSGGSAMPMLSRSGVFCYEYPIRTKSELNPKLGWALPQIVSLVREEKYDVIHAHTRVTQVLAFFVSKMSGVPYVSTAHGFYTPRFGRRLFPAWGSRVIAISSLVGEELENAHRVPPGRIRVVHNAVDIDAFLRRLGQQDRDWMKMRYGVPKGSLVVGALSRLVRDKGHEYLVDAVKRLVPEFPSVYLLIVGDGREKQNLERLIQRQLPGRAKLIPGVQDTTAVLAMMDVFAHPATWREGFGLSIAEAMIAKLPVVATDIPAINTLLKDGQNGRVVAPKSGEALAEALGSLLRDRKLAARLAGEGFKTATALCRPERMADEVEKVYAEAIEERRGK
jgi:glycosyltransferase involved in cell wall biosynthesis